MDALSQVESSALIPYPVVARALAVVPVTRDLATVATAARQRIAELVEGSISVNSRRAYEGDWRAFESWCQSLGVSALPASVDTVLAYASELPTAAHSERHGRWAGPTDKMGYSAATIQRRMSTIGARHKAGGFDNPCAHPHVVTLLKGIRREIGTAPLKRKAALTTDHLRRLRRIEDSSVRQIRDTALLLVGFAGGFRRSELCALNLEDLEWSDRTLTVLLKRSKTDQTGAGRRVVLHAGSGLCPIAALRRWIEASGISSGPLFRAVRKGGKVGTTRLSTEAVSQVVKGYAAVCGLDAARYGGHSLRVGHICTAILAGESDRNIMRVTGHKSPSMISRYWREDLESMQHNSSASLGL